MKEQYMMQVEKALPLPHGRRKEVIRDLQEVFASALEHGETEQEVIARLGSPTELAKNIAEQFGAAPRRRKTGTLLVPVFFFLAAAACLGLFLAVQLHRTPENIIGQGSAMTSILLSSPLSLDIPGLLMTVGIASLIIAVISAIKLYRQKVSE